MKLSCWLEPEVPPIVATATHRPVPSLPVVGERAVGVRRLVSRRRLLLGGLGLVLPVALVATSFGSYVLVDNGDTFQGRAVTWARDHHLGSAVNALERRRYSSPPSRTAARQLGLNPGQTVGPPPLSLTPTSVVSAGPTLGPAAGTATTMRGGAAKPLVGAPAPLPAVVAPALAGEGTWQAFASTAGQPVVWATSIRPSAAFPSVVASMAEIDQTHLRLALFNGTDVPGGAGWKLGDHVPPALQPALVAAFNGGFRFDNEPGGYLTEGRVVRPLLGGQATLAIDRAGRLFVGEYGRDLTNDGTWVSLRQNLPLIVDGGASQVLLKPGTNWGKNYHDVIFVTRSALCLRADGRYAYVTVGPVDAPLLGDDLVALGCQRAIELDINGTWPTFFSFHAGPGGHETADFLDNRMGGSRTRYLTGSSKEFFAAFDPSAVPPGSVLDAP